MAWISNSRWYSPKRRVLELLGVSNGIADLAVFVEAAGEESWSRPARTCLSFAITASVFAIASSTVSSTAAMRYCSAGAEVVLDIA